MADRILGAGFMSLADLDVARQLAAHPKWEWLAGVVALWRWKAGDPVMRHYKPFHRIRLHESGRVPGWWTKRPADCEYAVDLSDDATAGVLLGMLPADRGWEVQRRLSGRAVVLGSWGALYAEGWTPGVALAKALLKTWGPA